jgi:hypothetical protein
LQEWTDLREQVVPSIARIAKTCDYTTLQWRHVSKALSSVAHPLAIINGPTIAITSGTTAAVKT